MFTRFLKPIDHSQSRLAKDISVDPQRINQIVRGERAISADRALRLRRCYGNPARLWINLQTHCDLEVHEMELGDRLKEEVELLS